MSDALRAALVRAAERLGEGGVEFVIERPRDETHGDLATNLAMAIAKRRRTNPRAVAEELLRSLDAPADLVAKAEIAGRLQRLLSA